MPASTAGKKGIRMIFNGSKYREERKKKKLSLVEVFEITKQIDPEKKGVTESTIQRLEKGKRDNPKLGSLCMMIKALGLKDLNKFVNWDELGTYVQKTYIKFEKNDR